MHIRYTDSGDGMRFELYSFAELFGSYRYRFRTESNIAEELLLYMVTTFIEDDGWILLDNKREGCGFATLGFATEPAEEEYSKRVFYCKVSRELSKKGNGEDVWDTLTFENREEEVFARVKEESRKFCEKLSKKTCL